MITEDKAQGPESGWTPASRRQGDFKVSSVTCIQADTVQHSSIKDTRTVRRLPYSCIHLGERIGGLENDCFVL